MKTKKLSKKLTLNKKTVADLKNDEMNDVYGGKDEITIPVTFTCYPAACTTVTGVPCKAC